MSALLIRNATVITMDEANPRAAALAVRDGRILLAGTEEAARAAVGPDAVEIDAGGRTVLPGFIDPHNHLLSTAESLAALDARYPTVTSVADLVAAVAARRSAPRRGSGSARSGWTTPNTRRAVPPGACWTRPPPSIR